MTEHAYIHIPFCLRKCKYCSFVSAENIANKEIYLKTLLFEIKHKYKNNKLKTLYFGGGTPSLLNVEDIEKILSCFCYQQNAEISLEVNPETVSYSKFLDLKKLGINRISLGVQTFDNKILKYIGRKHDENLIYKSVENIKLAGFENISVDLIYGLPSQTTEIFLKDLKKAAALTVQHISSYGLKIESGSYFSKNPPEQLPNDEKQAQMYLLMCDFMKTSGFKHYEISNFAKEGYESKHNLAYWQNKNYYGFGLNACGFESNIRYKNQSELTNYLNFPLSFEEKSFINEKENAENEIFLALRLQDGINIALINKKYNMDFETKYKSIIKKYMDLNLMERQQNQIRLTKAGILLSNEIMAEFID